MCLSLFSGSQTLHSSRGPIEVCSRQVLFPLEHHSPRTGMSPVLSTVVLNCLTSLTCPGVPLFRRSFLRRRPTRYIVLLVFEWLDCSDPVFRVLGIVPFLYPSPLRARVYTAGKRPAPLLSTASLSPGPVDFFDRSTARISPLPLTARKFLRRVYGIPPTCLGPIWLVPH